MFKSSITLFFAVLAITQITACTTPEQRYAQEQRAQVVQRGLEARRQASLDIRCRGYGFELGTTGFAQCMMKLDQAERQTAQAQNQRKELESRCGLAEAQGWLAPTATGSFSEGAQRAAAAYNACMAGLPTPKSNRVICRREGRDEVYCFNQ
jgi:hypothetical protein